MATATNLIQHPRHEKHPLEPRKYQRNSNARICGLCNWKISSDGYACRRCNFFIHGVCAESPPRIDSHPLHPDHPLTLIHRPPRPFYCDACDERFAFTVSSFRCDECDFDLDLRCALATQSDREGSLEKALEQIRIPLHIHALTSFSTKNEFIGTSKCVICKESVEANGYTCLGHVCNFLIHQACIRDLFGDAYGLNVNISCASSTLLDHGGAASTGKTPKWIALPLHHHLLTSFSARYGFIGDSDCVICQESVEEDGYACCHWRCKFLIHKTCVPDLYYSDQTKAPTVYHVHPLEIFLGEDIGYNTCANCESKELLGEFIGCEMCEVFIHRDCVQVPEIIQYPHHPDHNLVLWMNGPDNEKTACDSCDVFLDVKLLYGCPSCEFFVCVECASQVIAYCEKGMSAETELPWHEHPLFLCYRADDPDWHCCSYCDDRKNGAMYACKDEDCRLILHKRCTEIESTRIHPHHPDHPITLCSRGRYQICEACSEQTDYLKFSCELCSFYLHTECSARFPTRKHPLHEHRLLDLDKAPSWACNRCGCNLSSHFFRCIPCNFNLHETCMDLPPRVLKSEVHWHSLTLHETYVEDDSGEYYCDLCEQTRDSRLGAYVCLQCSARWVYHIECVLPEFRTFFVKEPNDDEIERLERVIAAREEEVREAERTLDERKRELDELRKKHAALTDRSKEIRIN